MEKRKRRRERKEGVCVTDFVTSLPKPTSNDPHLQTLTPPQNQPAELETPRRWLAGYVLDHNAALKSPASPPWEEVAPPVPLWSTSRRASIEEREEFLRGRSFHNGFSLHHLELRSPGTAACSRPGSKPKAFHHSLCTTFLYARSQAWPLRSTGGRSVPIRRLCFTFLTLVYIRILRLQYRVGKQRKWYLACLSQEASTDREKP